MKATFDDPWTEVTEVRRRTAETKRYNKAKKRILAELRTRQDPEALSRAQAFFVRTDDLADIIREMTEAYDTAIR